jgi:hypothetical protein
LEFKVAKAANKPGNRRGTTGKFPRLLCAFAGNKDVGRMAKDAFQKSKKDKESNCRYSLSS